MDDMTVTVDIKKVSKIFFYWPRIGGIDAELKQGW